MEGKFNFKLVGLCAVLSALLLIPTLAKSQDDMSEELKEEKINIVKQLKLAPEKEKTIINLEEEYSAKRKEILDSITKALADLEAELKKAKPDEAKVQGLVKSLTTKQDNLFASFKEQRDKEMALMTPIEEGQYLLALGKWREEMMEEYEKEEEPEKPEKKEK